jgi:hypothetical protein
MTKKRTKAVKAKTPKATRQGRPSSYTPELIQLLVDKVTPSRDLKTVVANYNTNKKNLRKKDFKLVKYVPLLVAMERVGMNLRRATTTLKGMTKAARNARNRLAAIARKRA